MTQYALSKWYQVDVLDISSWEKNTANIRYIPFDLSRFTEKQVSELWKYDICICNAGISLSGDFSELDFEKERNIFEINTLWHIRLVKLLLQWHKIKSSGNIGFTISASQMLPFPIAVAYASSKGALDSFAISLRSYLYGKDISVSCIYPWPMDTPHVKYYGKKINNPQKALKKVQKIAKKSFQGIEKWKRNIYPDTISIVLFFTQPFQRLLDKIMYNTYKNQFKK